MKFLNFNVVITIFRWVAASNAYSGTWLSCSGCAGSCSSLHKFTYLKGRVRVYHDTHVVFFDTFALPDILLQRLNLIKSDSFLILHPLLSDLLSILLFLEPHGFFSVLAHGSGIELTFR